MEIKLIRSINNPQNNIKIDPHSILRRIKGLHECLAKIVEIKHNMITKTFWRYFMTKGHERFLC